MRLVSPIDVTGMASSFELEAEELYAWPRIEYRLELREDALEVVLCAVRFHGVDVLPRLSDEERAFYRQQCLVHRQRTTAVAVA